MQILESRVVGTRFPLFDLSPSTALAALDAANNIDGASLRNLLKPYAEAVVTVVLNREQGGAIVNFGLRDSPALEQIFLCFAGLVGTPIPEDLQVDGMPMEPRSSVHISLGYRDLPAGRLRHFVDPTLDWPLHTDRALHTDPGDFLQVGALSTEAMFGGDIRLLHISDFSRRDEFLAGQFAAAPLYWRGDHLLGSVVNAAAVKAHPGVLAPVFETEGSDVRIRYTDFRFRRPRSAEQAEYLRSLGEALEQDALHLDTFQLPSGSLYVIDNRRVLHGRSGFENNPHFTRKLHRVCGRFRKEQCSA